MDEQRAQRKLDELKKRREGFRNFWNAKAGKENYIRILPNWELNLEADFFYETAYHRNLGTKKDTSAVCLLAEGQQECPICEEVKGLWKTKSKEDIELAKSIKAYTRVYYNVIDLNDKKKGVQQWQTGVDVLEQLLGYCSNPKYGDLTDPFKGRNVVVVFTKGSETKSGFNEYVVQPDPDRTAIDDEKWLESLIDLKSMVKVISIDKMLGLLYGEEPEEKKDEQDQSTTKEEKVSEKVSETTHKGCFERAKFSSDDEDCIICSDAKACEEKKKVKVAGNLAKPADVKPAETKVPSEPDRKANTAIQGMIEKIQRETAEAKAKAAEEAKAKAAEGKV
jgi:hypothetical protein